MKKKLYLGMILIILTIMLSLFFINFNFNNKNKFYCNLDTDCILSKTDKKEPLICVNTKWYEYNKRDVGIQCDSKKKINCLCKNNICVRDDNKTGCN